MTPTQKRNNRIVLIILLPFVVFGLYKEVRVNFFGRCTVGETTGFSSGQRGYRYVNFKYVVDSVVYESRTDMVKQFRVPDGKYLVKYWDWDPGYSEMYSGFPLDSLEMGAECDCKDFPFFPASPSGK